MSLICFILNLLLLRTKEDTDLWTNPNICTKTYILDPTYLKQIMQCMTFITKSSLIFRFALDICVVSWHKQIPFHQRIAMNTNEPWTNIYLRGITKQNCKTWMWTGLVNFLNLIIICYERVFHCHTISLFGELLPSIALPTSSVLVTFWTVSVLYAV